MLEILFGGSAIVVLLWGLFHFKRKPKFGHPIRGEVIDCEIIDNADGSTTVIETIVTCEGDVIIVEEDVPEDTHSGFCP